MQGRVAEQPQHKARAAYIDQLDGEGGLSAGGVRGADAADVDEAYRKRLGRIAGCCVQGKEMAQALSGWAASAATPAPAAVLLHGDLCDLLIGCNGEGR